ncbi:SpoIIE family protein phosphatase [Ferruginibacter paludis]|uniref:SpoIIE family protein phosphatase n=1 Tax=Ferruginibacter paludis TaxID=1310417 RepID=UPI0025B33D7E|nr:SpoIIE family protein phosphatase [Ferruginibacter paludis]MDN3655320.1 SpoIIE family protein phosphatase [Ferruginibacter paludis]
MVESPHSCVTMPNRTYQAYVRSEIKKIAKLVGFAGNRLGELEIIVAELTSNLVKHTTGGGEILIKKIKDETEYTGIELICIDSGPGMSVPLKMMQDGISTTKTLGQGLGAIKRLSDEFDLYTLKGWGTIVLSRLFLVKPAVVNTKKIDVKVLMVSKPGEIACGDRWDVILKGSVLKFIIADGLGHGIHAQEASVKAIESFRANQKMAPDDALIAIDAAIRKTRGAVINITQVDFSTCEMTYCGVGNISSKVVSGKTKSFISYNGIIGHSIPNTMNNHVYKWEKQDVLVLHSDGINTRWDIQKYPQILFCDGSIVAAALYKDNKRGNDDVTIGVIRQKHSSV